MDNVFECKCGATLEIEIDTDEYYMVECFECGYMMDNASYINLKKQMIKDGCKKLEI